MFIVSITRSSEKRKSKIMTEVLVDTSKSSESKEADLLLHAVYILGLQYYSTRMDHEWILMNHFIKTKAKNK